MNGVIPLERRTRRIPAFTLDYLFSRSIPEPNSGCWIWLGILDAGRYGTFKLANRPFKAHRIAWQAANKKEIPNGLFVCHKCDTPECCNPDHLFTGTSHDNAVDREKKGRGRHTRYIDGRPVCGSGHFYPEDFDFRPGEGMRCPICYSAAKARERAKAREKQQNVRLP